MTSQAHPKSLYKGWFTKMKMCEFTHPQVIQDVDDIFSSVDFELKIFTLILK